MQESTILAIWTFVSSMYSCMDPVQSIMNTKSAFLLWFIIRRAIFWRVKKSLKVTVVSYVNVSLIASMFPYLILLYIKNEKSPAEADFVNMLVLSSWCTSGMIFRDYIAYNVAIKKLYSCTYLDFLTVRVVLSLPSSVDVANGLTRHTFEGSDIFVSIFLEHSK